MNNDDYLVAWGGPVKSLGSRRIGGRFVTFSTPQSPDRQKEFFDSSTDFWLSGSDRRPIIFRHGMDSTLKTRRFGEGMIQKASDGLWLTGSIDARDEHAERLLDMAVKGQLNWSSGSVGHLVEKTPTAWGSSHIDSWPVAEISLAPHSSVVEPRNILSLKSLALAYDSPDFDSLIVSKRNEAAEQQARKVYVDLLVNRYEMQRREFERSQHDDSISEEQAYYNALAEIKIRKFEQMRSS